MFDLKGFREAIGIGQKELSTQLGCDQSIISKIEGGYYRNTPKHLLQKLQEVYGDKITPFVDSIKAPTTSKDNYRAKYYDLLEKYTSALEQNKELHETLSRFKDAVLELSKENNHLRSALPPSESELLSKKRSAVPAS